MDTEGNPKTSENGWIITSTISRLMKRGEKTTDAKNSSKWNDGLLSIHRKRNAALFIPGLGAGINMYEPQQQYFETAYQVIIPELRGNGRSGSLNGVSSNQVMDVQCHDIHELMNQLNIESAVFIGVSYGECFVKSLPRYFQIRLRVLWL